MHDDKRPQSLDEIGGELRAAMNAADQAAPRRRSRMRIAIAVGAATAIACVALLVSLLGSDSDKLFTVDEAVAAVAQAAFDVPRKHPDEYLYTRSSETFFGGRSMLMDREYKWIVKMSATREAWSRTGHTSWTRTVMSPGEFPTAKDRATALAADKAVMKDWRRRNGSRRPPQQFLDMSDATPAGGEIVCKLTPDNAWLSQTDMRAIPGTKTSKLPDTPKAMYRYLYAHTERSVRKTRRQDWVWQMIGSAMSSGAALSPEQRSAMIGAIAYIPKVKTFGEVTDPAGRAAIGFSHTGLGKIRRMYFDRETGLTSYTDTVSSNGRPVQGAGTWKLENFEYVKRPPRLKSTEGRSINVLLACPYVGPKGHYVRARSARSRSAH